MFIYRKGAALIRARLRDFLVYSENSLNSGTKYL